ncbi:hypothetical protein LOC51_21455 [Rubrivivax sp. JA1024]|nr:hypothetical protein [Rubrivivax sp. JA1024]
MVVVADYDIANPYSDTDPAGALDLRTTDFDRIAAADVLFDGVSQPRRHYVEIDRAGTEPQPKPGKSGGQHHADHGERDGDALQPRTADGMAAGPFVDAMQTETTPLQQLASTMTAVFFMRVVPMTIVPMRVR